MLIGSWLLVFQTSLPSPPPGYSRKSELCGTSGALCREIVGLVIGLVSQQDKEWCGEGGAVGRTC